MNSETYNQIPDDVLRQLRGNVRIDESVPTGKVRTPDGDVPLNVFVEGNRHERRMQAAARNRKRNKKQRR